MAVFTWHGCVINIEGTVESYTSKETPMMFYLNIHGALENMRTQAAAKEKRGPTLMVCGPTDVGKTTLCQLLLNYAVRRGRTPAFVDLDVGQGTIGVPGTIGVNVIERPADVESGFSQVAPLIFHYGSNSPGSNMDLYKLLITQSALAVKKRGETDPAVRSAGTIINTCGWTTGAGLKALLYTAKAFEVDVILVIDQEKLYNELVKGRELPRLVKVIFTPKSGGVVTRSKENRQVYRDSRIREYFYGSGLKDSTNTQFYPHSFEVPFQKLKVYKVGAPSIPDSCMPLGMKANDTQTKIVPVTAGHSLLHHLLSLTYCTPAFKSQAVEKNIQGVVCVSAVDTEREMLTILSPQPKPLPTDCIFLLSEVQFMDSQ